MHPILALLLGLAFAGLGGDLFVRGAVGLAHWARVPAGIVGATVAAFATSSPELTVAVNSARAGSPELALGDVIGSNVVNVGLILGLALLMRPIRAGDASLRRDVPAALLSPVLIAALLLDGTLSRADGAIILSAFVVWLALTVSQARRARDAAVETLGGTSRWKTAASALAGLALLVLAGSLIVDGAKDVGGALGWSTFVVGATLVSIGTSMPELATTVMSRLHGHDEVGLGAILGSNVFNGGFIVGIAALIHPIPVAVDESLVGLGFALASVFCVLPRRADAIGRGRGLPLLALYAAYVAFLLVWRHGQGVGSIAHLLLIVGAPLALVLALGGLGWLACVRQGEER